MAILVKSDSARNFEDLPPTHPTLYRQRVHSKGVRSEALQLSSFYQKGASSHLGGRAGGASLQRLWKVVVDVHRSVSGVFEGNVSGGKMSWPIWMLHKPLTRSASRGSHLLGFDFAHAKYEQQGFMG